MKRYLLFAGLDSDPKGGWYDFIEGFDSQGAAESFYIALKEDPELVIRVIKRIYKVEWGHIIDIQTGHKWDL